MSLRWCESPGNAARIAALSADQAPTAIIGCPHMPQRLWLPKARGQNKLLETLTTGCGFFFFLRKKISARGTGSKKCNVNEVIFIDFASTTSLDFADFMPRSRALL